MLCIVEQCFSFTCLSFLAPADTAIKCVSLSVSLHTHTHTHTHKSWDIKHTNVSLFHLPCPCVSSPLSAYEMIYIHRWLRAFSFCFTSQQCCLCSQRSGAKRAHLVRAGDRDSTSSSSLPSSFSSVYYFFFFSTFCCNFSNSWTCVCVCVCVCVCARAHVCALVSEWLSVYVFQPVHTPWAHGPAPDSGR